MEKKKCVFPYIQYIKNTVFLISLATLSFWMEKHDQSHLKFHHITSVFISLARKNLSTSFQTSLQKTGSEISLKIFTLHINLLPESFQYEAIDTKAEDQFGWVLINQLHTYSLEVLKVLFLFRSVLVSLILDFQLWNFKKKNSCQLDLESDVRSAL